jgi:GNAT superfamily N-acetyltransferase
MTDVAPVAYVVSMSTAAAWRRRGIAWAILLDLVGWTRGLGIDVAGA